jgi:hypothetical protein
VTPYAKDNGPRYRSLVRTRGIVYSLPRTPNFRYSIACDNFLTVVRNPVTMMKLKVCILRHVNLE